MIRGRIVRCAEIRGRTRRDRLLRQVAEAVVAVGVPPASVGGLGRRQAVQAVIGVVDRLPAADRLDDAPVVLPGRVDILRRPVSGQLPQVVVGETLVELVF